MSRSKATEAALNALHEALANELKRQLEEGAVVEVDGEAMRVSPKAATLNVIRAFLKDNAIEVDPASPGEAVSGLRDALRGAEDLPFPVEDGGAAKH